MTDTNTHVVAPGELHRLNWLRCPECGAAVDVHVEEWYAKTGVPTEAGVYVTCSEYDFFEDGNGHVYVDCSHRFLQCDWMATIDAAANWAREHLRVCEIAGTGYLPEK